MNRPNESCNANEKDLAQKINTLLINLGHTDETIRDYQAYPQLMNIILNHELSQNLLNNITEQLLNNLTKGIGTINNDTVFLRSFSVLTLVGILKKDNEAKFLSNEIAHHIIQQFVTYFKNEQDIRGYVPNKGWAHSMAHSADLAMAIVQSRFYHEDIGIQLLETIAFNLFKLDEQLSPYIDDEGERFTFVIIALLERGFDKQLVIQWVERLYATLLKLKNEGITYYRKKKNIEDCIKSLYFRIHDKNEYTSLTKSIASNIRQSFKRDYNC